MTKTWIDGNNKETTRPASVTVNLLVGEDIVATHDLTASENWSYTFSDLQKYDDQNNEIKYSVEEIKVDKYSTEIKGGEITNTLVTEVPVTKTWQDGGDTSKRPQSITYRLMVGENEVDSHTATADNWNYTFTNLPMYDATGTTITYTVTEDPVEGYITNVNGNDVTNTLKTEATVRKVWNDSDNQDGIRPASLTVTLSNGTEVTLNEANGWTATVENLPMYDEKGVKIEYSWTEGEMPEGYTLTGNTVSGTVSTLTNKYTKIEVDTIETDAEFAKKTVESRTGFAAKEFTFTLSGDGLDAPRTQTVNFTEAGTKAIDFGTITYTEAGIYKYTVKETAETAEGWTLDLAEHEVTVVVTETNGTLSASVTGTTLTNKYDTQIIVNTIEVGAEFAKKTVESKTGFAAKEFTFTLSGDGLAAPRMQSVNFTEAGTKAINFGTITYTEAGTYKYTVTETAEDAAGWTFDLDEHTVTVVVTDNNGTLSAAVTGTTLTNKYETSIVVNTVATGAEFAQKTVEGTGFAARDFMFTLSGDGIDARTQTVNFTEAGTKAIDFGTITYTEAGTYSYTVRETAVTAEGWTFDLDDHTVTVVVTDTNGTLSAAVSGTTLTNRWVPQTYPVIVRYVDIETGEEIISPVTMTVPVGGRYDIESPAVPGYVLLGDEIVSGTVTNAGVNRVVYYAPVVVPSGGTPDEPSGEGESEPPMTLYTLVDIADLETPLGLGGLNINVGECIE